jgi:predicted  nucleic acid-binding Zn-ribbon protein
MRLLSPGPLAVLFALSCVSCNDDPKLVAKRDEQNVEIAKLKGELALIEEKLKTLPPDVTAQLAEAKELSAKQSSEVAVLEAEVTGLEARKRSLQSEFDAYKLKYQVK